MHISDSVPSDSQPTMTLLHDTAEYFQSRDVPIDRWFSDDQGRYGFSVQVDGERFYVAALSNAHEGGTVSVMYDLVDRAIEKDGMVLLRVGDDYLVFAPDMIKKRNERGAIDMDRAERGEQWLHVPVDWGVGFQRYMEQGIHPREQFGDLRDWEGGVGV